MTMAFYTKVVVSKLNNKMADWAQA